MNRTPAIGPISDSDRANKGNERLALMNFREHARAAALAALCSGSDPEAAAQFQTLFDRCARVYLKFVFAEAAAIVKKEAVGEIGHRLAEALLSASKEVVDEKPSTSIASVCARRKGERQ